MKHVKSNSKVEIIIKNSRFVALLFRVFTEDDITEILCKVKNEYPKATHYCYAYILPTSRKSSDDGEPGGTAGMPILNVLDKEELINTLIVVVRYFGGIKLGAGGLVRAYTKAAKEVIDSSILVDIREGYLVKITTDYTHQKELDYLLREAEIVDKKYDLDVCYFVLLPKTKLDIINNYSYQIVDERYIEKTSNC